MALLNVSASRGAGRYPTLWLFVCLCLISLVQAGFGQADRVDQLIKQLGSSDAGVRVSAKAALVQIGASAVEPLIAALTHPDSGVRYRAAECLGEIKDPRAVDPLIAALRDPVTIVESSAAKALGEIGDPRAVAPLMSALQGRSPYAPGNEAEALAKIKDPQAADERMRAILKEQESTLGQRTAASVAPVKAALITPVQREDIDFSKAKRLYGGPPRAPSDVVTIVWGLRNKADVCLGRLEDGPPLASGQKQCNKLANLSQVLPGTYGIAATVWCSEEEPMTVANFVNNTRTVYIGTVTVSGAFTARAGDIVTFGVVDYYHMYGPKCYGVSFANAITR
jgi:hypothetical protein